MTDLLLDPPAMASPPADGVRDALMESRQRWQNLVGLAADLAFETDAEGRFVFVIPDTVLGWLAGSLIGQPTECLAGDDGAGGPSTRSARPSRSAGTAPGSAAPTASWR